MGRKNHRGHAPQRSRLVANREQIRAINGERPRPFGVRRQLTYETYKPLIDGFVELLDDAEDFATVVPRSRELHVTLMPMRELSSQLRRGLVLGYEFGRQTAAIENDLKKDPNKQLFVGLGRAAVIKNRYITVLIDNPTLEAEHKVVRTTLAEAGLKGALKHSEPLHVTLGELAGRERLSHLKKSQLEGQVDEMLDFLKTGEQKRDDSPMRDPFDGNFGVMLNPLEFYPTND